MIGLLNEEKVYVITDTIKSRKFTVMPKDSQGKGLDVQIPEIQRVVGAKIKVSGDKQGSSATTYEGKKPLVFGFKAVQLFYMTDIMLAKNLLLMNVAKIL